MLAVAVVLTLTHSALFSGAMDAEDPQPPESQPAKKSGWPARPQGIEALQPTEGTPASDASQLPPTPPKRQQRTAIYGIQGFGTPVGADGIEAVRLLTDNLEIAAGVGIGLGASGAPGGSAANAVQWAVMPRLRFGDARGGVTLGAGLSGGNYVDPFSCLFDFDGECSPPPPSYFLWENLEIGGEHWFAHGFALRWFVGYAHGSCVSSTCVSAPQNLPYFGMGFGYAF
jgi:hypothetical protein